VTDTTYLFRAKHATKTHKLDLSQFRTKVTRLQSTPMYDVNRVDRAKSANVYTEKYNI